MYAIEQDFEHLIHAFNPCDPNHDYSFKRNIKNFTIFKEIVDTNDYYKERIHYEIKNSDLSNNTTEVDATEPVFGQYSIVHLNKDFKVTPPTLNEYWCELESYLEKSNYTSTNYVIAAWVIVSLTVLSLYTFCKSDDLLFLGFKNSELIEANKLYALIKEDMIEKHLYKNGLAAKNIFSWYSGDITYNEPEFNAKVLPIIEGRLENSRHFRSTLSRTGTKVWKLAA